MMSSKTEQQKSEQKGRRLKIKDLPRQEEELKTEEARQIRGGGAAAGGVTGGNHRTYPEEIPQ